MSVISQSISRKILLMFVLICSSLITMCYLSTTIANTQDATPVFTPFPTPAEDLWPFPTGMFCADVESGPGPTWRGITVGKSSIADLETLLMSYSDDYSISDRGTRGVVFSIWDRRKAIDKGIPTLVHACTNDDIVVALSISMAEDTPSLYLDDWVAQFGEPDAVTWDGSAFVRTVFWFEEGIAITVLIVEPFGATLHPVFFPYQIVDGYEDRWPYNRTYTSLLPPHELKNPTPSMEQNPFDFSSMLATIAVEPTRTPTPTFTPPPSPSNGRSGS